MLVRYCTAVALKRHERVNAFNLVNSLHVDRQSGCEVMAIFVYPRWPSAAILDFIKPQMTDYCDHLACVAAVDGHFEHYDVN